MSIDAGLINSLITALEKAACKSLNHWVFLHPQAPIVRRLQVCITDNNTGIHFPDSFGLAQDIRDACSAHWPAVVKQTNALRDALPSSALPFTVDLVMASYITDAGVKHKVDSAAYFPAIVPVADRFSRSTATVLNLMTMLNKLDLIRSPRASVTSFAWVVSKTAPVDPESPMLQDAPTYLGTVHARSQDEATLKAAALVLHSREFESLITGTPTEQTRSALERVIVAPGAPTLLDALIKG